MSLSQDMHFAVQQLGEPISRLAAATAGATSDLVPQIGAKCLVLHRHSLTADDIVQQAG